MVPRVLKAKQAPTKSPVKSGKSVAPAPSTMADEEDDAPVDPKTLWQCPHCGARNKPKRTTCRECGKSPEEAVVGPYSNPRQIGIIGLTVLVIFALLNIMTTDDVSMRPSGLDYVDQSIRSVSVDGQQQVGDFVLTVEQQIAASGRIVAIRGPSAPLNSYEVTLVIGDPAIIGDDQEFRLYKPKHEPKSVDLLRKGMPAPLDTN